MKKSLILILIVAIMIIFPLLGCAHSEPTTIRGTVTLTTQQMTGGGLVGDGIPYTTVYFEDGSSVSLYGVVELQIGTVYELRIRLQYKPMMLYTLVGVRQLD